MVITIIDDELEARNNLKILIPKFISTPIRWIEASSIKQAVEVLHIEPPSLCFLDIQLTDGTGFDLLDQVEIDCPIIFVTAYDNYAIKAFQYHAMYYILKPIDGSELKEAISRSLQYKDLRNNAEHNKDFISKLKNQDISRLTLSTQEGYYQVAIKDVVRLESYKNYTTFILSNKPRITISKTIGDFEKILPEDLFIRTHQSHIIAIDQLDKIRKDKIVLKNGEVIPLARRRKEKLLKWLKIK